MHVVADAPSPLEGFLAGGFLHCVEHYTVGRPVHQARIRHLAEPEATMRTSFLWMMKKKSPSADANSSRYRTATLPLVVEGGLFVNLKSYGEGTVERVFGQPKGSVLNGMLTGGFSGAATSLVGFPLGALIHYYRTFVVDAAKGSSSSPSGAHSFQAYCNEISRRSLRFALDECRVWALRLMMVNWLLSRRETATAMQEIGDGIVGGAVAGLISCALEPSAGIGLLRTWARGYEASTWAWIRFRCGLWQKVVSSSALTVALISVPSVLHSHRDALRSSMSNGMDWLSLGVFGGC
jgi:hypothetical protein